MGTPTAKVFLELGGQPMAVYSLQTLATLPDIRSLVLVVARDQESLAGEMLERFGPWAVPISLARGGAERQDSVAAGLSLVPSHTDLVVVHDAARPFVSRSCLQACVDAGAANGAAIVAMPARDTVKLVDANGMIDRTIDRERIWLAQTPQVFRAPLLRQAYDQAQRDGIRATDDAALIERLGHPVRIVSGEPTNRKITTPEDLRWAEWFLHSQEAAR